MPSLLGFAEMLLFCNGNSICHSHRYVFIWVGNHHNFFPFINIFHIADLDKMELHVHISIEAILDLDELKSAMKLQLSTEVYWVDSRLTYINVHKDKLKLITTDQKQKLWLPRLIVATTKDQTEIAFNGESTHGEIKLNRNLVEKIAKWDVVQNYKKYSGSEGYGALIYKLLSYFIFNCKLQEQFYGINFKSIYTFLVGQ